MRYYYLHFSIEEQIIRFLQDYEHGEQLVKHMDAERTPKKIMDTYDDTLYRNGILLLGRALSLILTLMALPFSIPRPWNVARTVSYCGTSTISEKKVYCA